MILVTKGAYLGIRVEILSSVKLCSTLTSNNIQGVVLFLFSRFKHRHLFWKSQQESLRISWTQRPAQALWLLIRAGVYWQEDVRKLLLLLSMMFLFFRKDWRLKMRTQQYKKVHLYKTLVISQIKNWIQMLIIVGLVSLQVMFCPSFPQVISWPRLLRPCDLWASLCHPMPGDHSEAGTAKGCSAVVSSIGQPFQLHDKETKFLFFILWESIGVCHRTEDFL